MNNPVVKISVPNPVLLFNKQKKTEILQYFALYYSKYKQNTNLPYPIIYVQEYSYITINKITNYYLYSDEQYLEVPDISFY